MKTLQLLRLYMLLLAIFIAGRLFVGSKLPYERGSAIFSVVTMTILASVFYGAFLRRWGRFSIGKAILLGLLIGLLGQVAIMAATALSYQMNVETYFNHRLALNVDKLEKTLGFSQAMVVRTRGLVANCILNGIAGGLGWLFGGALPEKP